MIWQNLLRESSDSSVIPTFQRQLQFSSIQICKLCDLAFNKQYRILFKIPIDVIGYMLQMRHRSGKFFKCKWCMEFPHQLFINSKHFALFGAFLLSLISSDVAASIIPSAPSLGWLGYLSRVFPSNIVLILFQKGLYFLGDVRGSEYTIPIKKDDHITTAMAYQP